MTLQVRSNPGKPISIMFGATQMPFYGKNNYYSPQTMYFRLLWRPLLERLLLGVEVLAGNPTQCSGARAEIGGADESLR